MECLHRKEARNGEQQLWESARFVRFLHVDTKRWLAAEAKTKFNQSNCPRCPILGELEVSATDHNSDAAIQSSIFGADDGAYIK